MPPTYHYRVIPFFTSDEIPNPYVCAHEWKKTDDPRIGDAYCERCRHYARLVEDSRNRPMDWWLDRAKGTDHDIRELE